MDINETALKNNVTIETEYSSKEIDTASMTYMTAKFRFNGTHLNCLSTQKWAQELPYRITYPDPPDPQFQPEYQQLCITNLTLLATFDYTIDDNKKILV